MLVWCDGMASFSCLRTRHFRTTPFPPLFSLLYEVCPRARPSLAPPPPHQRTTTTGKRAKSSRRRQGQTTTSPKPAPNSVALLGPLALPPVPTSHRRRRRLCRRRVAAAFAGAPASVRKQDVVVGSKTAQEGGLVGIVGAGEPWSQVTETQQRW